MTTRPALSIIFTALLSLVALTGTTNATAPQLPNIPATTVSIAERDALGDGVTDNTKAIQSTIDFVAKKGGRVIVPEGVFLCGPIKLASHVELHIAKGATLRLLPLSGAFPSDATSGRYLNFISAKDCTDITISGEGVIDGQGAPWWAAFTANELKLRRPQLIALENCERVLLENFTTFNPPNTHFALRLCKNVTMRGLTLRAPDNSRNTDGINISGKNYLIANCDISTGDDNIVILTHAAKGWSAPVCENFVIRDCAFGFGHGMSIGSYTGGGVRNVLVENCTFDGTSACIRMKAARGRGGLVENLTYRNITSKGARYPIFISSYYPKEPKSPAQDAAVAIKPTTPMWKNILVENFTATGAQTSIILWGVPEQPMSDITLRNVRISARESAKVFNARKIHFDNVVLDIEEAAENKKPALNLYHANVTGMTGVDIK